MGQTKKGSCLSWVLALAACQIAVSACGGEEEPAACTQLGDSCVGVPVEPLCDGAVCTENVPCNNVLQATTDAQLQSAIGDAQAGDCIALAPGSYGAAVLDGGVSLLGRAAAEVLVASVQLGDGSGAWLRGVEVSGGIDVGAATGVRLDAMHVSGGNHGLEAAAGAGVEVTRSTITGSQLNGVLATGDAGIIIIDSHIADLSGAGVWASCDPPDMMTDPCDCTAKPSVTLERVLISGPSIVGVNLIGTVAAMTQVAIEDVQTGPNFQPGGGLSVSGCSELTYTDVTVEKTDSYGVLIDGASALPGGGLGDKGIIIIDSKPGVWVQSTGAGHGVTLQGVEVKSCRGTGIGLDLGAQGIIIIDSLVASTALESMPVEFGGSSDLGLGLVWKEDAVVAINGLEVSGNATHGLLIDGLVGAGSSIDGVSLTGGDEQEGIVQQQVSGPDQELAGSNASEVQQNTGKVSEVPLGPEAP